LRPSFRTLPLLLAVFACGGGFTRQAAITVNPATASLTSNGAQQFTAAVTGVADTAAVWSIDEASGGTITTDGLYTAPSVSTSAAFHVRAVAHADASVSASAVVTVTPSNSAPVIGPFVATPASITAGSSSLLGFTVTGASQLSIDQGVGVVSETTVQVSPIATTTYTLTASNSAGTTTAQVTVTVTVTAAVPSAPVITSFTASPASIGAGQSSTLSLSAAGATSLSIAPSVGTVSGTSVSVHPTTTTTYTLTATNASGSVTATAQVTLLASDVTLTLDSSQSVHAISPLIYGYNDRPLMPSGTTFIRSGGNRLTAYNWETNASNAGSDFNYENDAAMSSSSVPGAAIWTTMDKNIPALITLPMQGWVSKDESGPVAQPFGAQSLRFFPSIAKKPSAFTSPPSTSDSAVYQDEFVNAVASRYPGRQLFLSLDNEPDLWSFTHAEIQFTPITYASLLSLTTTLASAVKDVAPTALIFGPVSYGYAGFQTLQGASDATSGEWFLDYFLRNMNAASAAQGRRLLDVLDLHWYPEATGGGVRIIEANNTAAVQVARVQAPRSLWDVSYVESSWITANNVGIDLVHVVGNKIAAAYPGTKLGFTEYNYGGADDISGAVAEADVLGVFGRESVYAATFWPLINDNRFAFGAWRSFRNFDNAGSAFGDTSFSALASDNSKAAVYASYDAGSPGRIVVVAINRTTGPLAVNLKLADTHTFTAAHAFQLTATSTFTSPSVIPTAVTDARVSNNVLQATLPAYSVTTYAFVP
jgi:hypothetical protein